ncbi:MAG: anti-sigma factor antagonist [Candidatus Brocadiae bacterium]|nr:anti-sigma factor antagonist [Candidatus Brocadiia bacterium]
MSKLQVHQRTVALGDGQDATLAKLSGSIDASTVPQFEEQIEKFMHDGVKYLMLDCAEISYINSTGMGLLIKCVDRFRNKDGDLKLISVPPKVVTLFKMLGLESLVDIYPNESAALASLKKAAPPAPEPPPEPKKKASEAPAAAPQKGQYPVQFKCPTCGGVLEIRAEGRYRCPRCGAFFSADPAGAVKSYPPRKWKAVEIRVPCDLEDLEWVRSMLASQVSRLKFSDDTASGLEQAVDEACTMMVSNSPPGAPAFHVAALSSGNELIVAIYSYTCGGAFKEDQKTRMSFEVMKNFMDKVEVLPLPPNGQMIKMTKVNRD